MTKDEALKLALEALTGNWTNETECEALHAKHMESITAIKEALAQPDVDRRSTESKETFDQQEPVAWLITDENINSIQIASIQRLIDRARHAHMADLKLRINGEDEWYELDWLKHLTRATPPQRTWVGLDWNEMPEIYMNDKAFEHGAQWAEAKLKEKNT